MKTFIEDVFKSWGQSLRQSGIKENSELAELMSQLDAREKDQKQPKNTNDNLTGFRGHTFNQRQAEREKEGKLKEPKTLAEVIQLSNYRKKTGTSGSYKPRVKK